MEPSPTMGDVDVDEDDDMAFLRSCFRPIPRPVLPDDCVEYRVYYFPRSSSSTNDDGLAAERGRTLLREVQKHAAALKKRWLQDYIWQRGGFGLELVTEDGEVLLPSPSPRVFL